MDAKKALSAIEAMKSAADECTTVGDYTARMLESDEEAAAEYKEVIQDELNHALRFLMTYSRLTGIEPATDGLEED